MTTKKLTASSTAKTQIGPFTSIDIDDEAPPPRRKPSGRLHQHRRQFLPSQRTAA